MKQRLGLAAALLQPRDLLILDEPTNGLDPQGTREVRHLVRSLAADGTTVLVSSHLLAEIEQVATHVGIMSAGRLLAQGALGDVLGGSATTVVVLTPDPERARAVLARLGLEGVSRRRGPQRRGGPGQRAAGRTAARGPQPAPGRGRRTRGRAQPGAPEPGGPLRQPHRGGLRCRALTCPPARSPPARPRRRRAVADRTGAGPTGADLRPRRGALRRLLASEMRWSSGGDGTWRCSPSSPGRRSSSASR